MEAPEANVVPVTRTRTGLGLDKVGVEVDLKGRVVFDSQYNNNNAPSIRCIGESNF